MNKRALKKQSGFALVESLVAIGLIGITMVGMTKLFTICFNANASTRSYAAVENDVQSIIDGYRVNTYTQLLLKFGSDPLQITNGQSVTETATGTFAKTDYSTRLTALKSSTGATPEAIRLTVTATQRRGTIGSTQYTFETLMAPTQ
jgi:type II secretory pathway pseudopilin PulG